jgi:branched-subunit amino acid transport protein AzlD
MGSKATGHASSTSRTSRAPGAGMFRVYPHWWRDRYEDEVAALMEARPPDLRARLDLLRGAFDAHLQGREPGKAPRGAVAAALLAGGAWTIAGIASIGGPTPPDWPGYLESTMPVALAGVLAMLVAGLGVARLAWSSNGPTVELAVLAVVVGHLAWAIALAVAILGGPYGAVTAITQSMAAIATAALGLVLLRAGAHPIGEAVVVAGAVLLVPTPAAWLVAGAVWTGIGLWQYAATRSGDWPRAVPG